MKTCKYCPIEIPQHRVLCGSGDCRRANARDYYHEKVKKAYSPPKISRKDEEMRELELKGLLPIESKGGLYEGCTPKQIRAMKSGNFKEFIEG